MKRAGGLLAVLVLAGCGSTTSAPTSTPTRTVVATTGGTTTAAAPGDRHALRIYLLRDGVVAPVARDVAKTKAVGAASLDALLAGPTADEQGQGLSSALPDGAHVARISIADGVATVELSPDLSKPAQAQVVYTLTQFPTVKSVRLGSAAPATRATYEDLTPIILVETPLPGEAITSPLQIGGTANTFEATFRAELVDGAGKQIAIRSVMATSGSGQRGTYSESIPFTAAPGAGRLVVFEDSAEDGSRIHQVEIPIRFG
jgi:hypothetical protein